MAEMAHIFEEERSEESPIQSQNETAENNNAIDLHDEVASGNGNGHDTVMVIDEDRDYGGVMEEEANEEVGSNSDNGKAVERRPRSQFRWTKEMHHYFVNIVDKIGGPERATPKSILQMMNVKDLNIGQLKYHLQMYRGKKLDKDGKVLPPRIRQLQENDSHMDILYPRTGSQSLYGFENRGPLGSNSFLEHDHLFQHPISHQLNPHSGNLWQQDLAFNQYPVPRPVWRNQAPANGLFYDMFSRNNGMPPQPLLQSSNVYNIGDAVMGNGIVTHHQFLMENRSPPSETIENQRKENVIWPNSEWIGSNSTPQLQPNLINFFEPSGWNNNQQFRPSSNDLNIMNNPPDPQLETQKVNTFIGFQKNENPQLKKYRDKCNLDLSLSLPLGDDENAEKLYEYAQEFSGELSLSLGPPSMKPQPQPSEELEETTESERTVTDIQLLETNITDGAATEEMIKASDPTSSIPAVE